MKPLSGLDGTFLHLETPATPMHVASLHLFEPPPGGCEHFARAVRAMLAARIKDTPVLRRKLAPMPLQFANPVWVDEPTVDLDAHVRSVTLPRPGGLAQLEACIGELHAQLLDRERPLWMLTLIEGLADGQAAFYVKIHHAVLDGNAGVALAHALFDTEARPPEAAASKPAKQRPRAEPGVLALAAAAVKHDAAQYVKLVRHLPDVARLVAGLVKKPDSPAAGAARGDSALWRNFAFGPKTALNVQITGERRFAALSLPLDALKAIAAEQGAKLNDVVLALCSGALRRYFAHHGGIPKKSLIAAMPISLREAGNTEFTTKATMAVVSLATQIADPLARLASIRDASSAVKAVAKRAESVLPTDYPSIGVPWVLGGLASLYGRSKLANLLPPIANLVISNVPGPKAALYSCGARMVAYWPISIVEHGLGLNITVMSYADTLSFGITSAQVAMPHPRQLADALRKSFEELAPAAATPTTRKPRAARAAVPGGETSIASKPEVPRKARAKVASAAVVEAPRRVRRRKAASHEGEST